LLLFQLFLLATRYVEAEEELKAKVFQLFLLATWIVENSMATSLTCFSSFCLLHYNNGDDNRGVSVSFSSFCLLLPVFGLGFRLSASTGFSSFCLLLNEFPRNVFALPLIVFQLFLLATLSISRRLWGGSP